MSIYRESRIATLDYLRAIACLLVVMGHIGYLGCVSPATVRIWLPSVADAPYPIAAGSPYAAAVAALMEQAKLNVGSLGVAIFFLLSGFVILHALDRETAGSFLVRRVFRIAPACVVATFLALALIAALCRADGMASPFTLVDGFASATVTMNYFSRWPVVPVLWSLEVEIAFYALMAAIAWNWRPIGLRPLFVAALATSNLAFLLFGTSRAPDVAPEMVGRLVHLSQTLIYMPLMLVGAAAYRCWSNGWRRGSTARVAVFLGLFFGAYSAYGPIAGWGTLGIDATAVAVALVLFAAAVAWRRGIPSLAPLRFVGAISYPLYLVHAPLGWAVLALAARHGFSVHAGCAAALAASLVAAWVLHVLVERPGQRLGAALAARLRLRPATGSLVAGGVAA